MERFSSEKEFYKWLFSELEDESKLFERISFVVNLLIEKNDPAIKEYFVNFLKKLVAYYKNTHGDTRELVAKLLKVLSPLKEHGFADVYQFVQHQENLSLQEIERFLEDAGLPGYLHISRGVFRLIHHLSTEGKDVEHILKALPALSKEEVFSVKIKEYIQRKGEEETIRIILSFLKYSYMEDFLNALLKFFKKEKVITVAMKCIEETDDNILSNALFQFLLKNAEDVLPHIHTFLGSKDMVLVVKGLKILEAIRRPEALKTVSNLLKHTNPVIQREALNVIMKTGTQEAVEVVKERFFYLTGEEQIEALKFLKKMGEREFLRELSSMEELQMNRDLYTLIVKMLQEEG